MGSLPLSLLLLATIAVGATAFLSPKAHPSVFAVGNDQSNHLEPTNAAISFATSSVSLSLSSSPDGNGSGSDAFPKARTDIRLFLTQRSIQSFVYLLNQCREEHTVRWLEKTLDFPSIDNFHGTGAFNQTKFPEWDSIFLDCVDRPEEVMVMEVRQRRRQRKLSGHNDYFESLKSPSSASKGKEDDDAKSETTKRSFSTTNYLDAMKPTTPPPSNAKKSQKPKPTARKLSGSSNYLDNIASASPAPKSVASPTKPSQPMKEKNSKTANEIGASSKDGVEEEHPATVCDAKKSEGKGDSKSSKKASPDLKKDDGEKKNLAAVCDAKKSEDKEDSKSSQKTFQRRTFSPGKSSSYLESLSMNSTAVSTGNGSLEEKDDKTKTKQSSELSKNPFLDEKTQEYELSIDPPALVRRILSVREQLSKEWAEDLDMLMKLNDEITESFEKYNNEAGAKDDEEDEDEDENSKINAEDNHFDDSSSDVDALLKALTAPIDEDSNPDASGKVDPEVGKGKTVFDRSLLSTWSQLLWSPKRSSSPYRKANFDLLLLLATQESIHRVLKSYKKDTAIRPETHQWLLDFYTENVNEYFDGHQTNGRSEDFLEEMLKSPRTLIETNNEILAWVDPAIVAEGELWMVILRFLSLTILIYLCHHISIM